MGLFRKCGHRLEIVTEGCRCENLLGILTQSQGSNTKTPTVILSSHGYDADIGMFLCHLVAVRINLGSQYVRLFNIANAQDNREWLWRSSFGLACMLISFKVCTAASGWHVPFSDGQSKPSYSSIQAERDGGSTHQKAKCPVHRLTIFIPKIGSKLHGQLFVLSASPKGHNCDQLLSFVHTALYVKMTLLSDQVSWSLYRDDDKSQADARDILGTLIAREDPKKHSCDRLHANLDNWICNKVSRYRRRSIILPTSHLSS